MERNEYIQALYRKGFTVGEIAEEVGLSEASIRGVVYGMRKDYKYRVRREGWVSVVGNGAWLNQPLQNIYRICRLHEEGAPIMWIFNRFSLSMGGYMKYIGMWREGEVDEIIRAYEDNHGPFDVDEMPEDPHFPEVLWGPRTRECGGRVVEALRDGPMLLGELVERSGLRVGVLRNVVYDLLRAGRVCYSVCRFEKDYVGVWHLGDEYLTDEWLSRVRVKGVPLRACLFQPKAVLGEFMPMTHSVLSKEDIPRAVEYVVRSRGGPMTVGMVREAVLDEFRVAGYLDVSHSRVLHALRGLRARGFVLALDGRPYRWVFSGGETCE